MDSAQPSIAVLSCNGGTVTNSDTPATRLIVATVKGIKVFDRDGDQWREIATALPDCHMSAVLYEKRSGLIFAGTHWNRGLYLSRDFGLTFEPALNGIEHPHIYSLAAQYRGDQTVLFCGTEPSALYRSDDLGESWYPLEGLLNVPDQEQWTFPPPPHVAHVKDIAWHPSNLEKLYVCIEQGALLISEDDGQTWYENRNYADPEKDMFRHDNHRVLFQNDPNCYFMCGGEGIYRTTDDGQTWQHLTTREHRIGYPDAMFIDPRDENTVIVAGPQAGPGMWPRMGNTSDPTVMISTDAGTTWQEKRKGFPDDLVGNIEAMGMHCWGDNITLFAGTATGDIYISDDLAEHWAPLALGTEQIAKNGHFRWFLTPEEKRAAEEMMGNMPYR